MIRDGRHPVLETGMKSGEFVPNDLLTDPDFLQWNPEFTLLAANYAIDAGTALVEEPNSDAASAVWKWILADPEAKAWLKQQPGLKRALRPPTTPKATSGQRYAWIAAAVGVALLLAFGVTALVVAATVVGLVVVGANAFDGRADGRESCPSRPLVRSPRHLGAGQGRPRRDTRA